MADELLTYYEHELNFLRQMSAEFARAYPKIAGRLLLGEDRGEDPHVERLLQAFAFLAARVHRKIDDEFPEITEALLNVLYPHYLAPLPSMSLVQFVVDPDRGKLTDGYLLERGAMLASPPVHGSRCRFRTCYPVTLWPVEVGSVRFEAPDRFGGVPKAVSVLRMELRCSGGATFADLSLKKLRFFLHGEGQVTYPLYELLLNHTCQVQLRNMDERFRTKPVVLEPRCVQAVGFAAEEGLLPYGARSFLGYRLLQEYFTFPEKFLFIDVSGFERTARNGFGDKIEVLFFLDYVPRPPLPIQTNTFRLGCTPIINLFSQIAEPIRVTHAQTEYRVIPDVQRQSMLEVYAIESVVNLNSAEPDPIPFHPFYSVKHSADRDRQRAYWYATRKQSPRPGDAGTEVYLSLVDLNFRPTLPGVETLTIHATCSNRDLPGRLPFGGERENQDDFELEGAAPLAHIRCLRKPTETVRPFLRRSVQWRLISHLSLNYLSLSQGGKDALQEILSLYDFTDSPVIRAQIEGIVDVTSRRVVRRPASMPWNGFCRGMEVTIEFDEQQYVGSGVFLFASVLENFFGLYASLNSFSQLVAKTKQRKELLKQWPPRAGEQILL